MTPDAPQSTPRKRHADIRIREADFGDPDDRAAVRSLVEAFADVSDVELTDTVRDTVAPFLGRTAAFVLLAEEIETDRRRPIGMLIAQRIIASFRACERMNIHDLYVEAEHRGHGLGRRMLDACADRGRAVGCCDLTLEVTGDNHVARGLYRSYGFDLPEGDVPDGAVLYGKCPIDATGSPSGGGG